MKSNTLSSILERIEPYDENTHSKTIFLQELNSRLHLKELLEKSLEDDVEWVKNAETIVCFILNDNRWKHPDVKHRTSNIRLSYIGSERVPTISLDLN